MLAERLNEVAYDVHIYVSKNQILHQIHEVQQLVEMIERGDVTPEIDGGQQAQDPDTSPRKPSDDSVPGVLSENLSQLEATLGHPRLNRFSPSEKSILQRIGGWELTGDRLYRRIEEILSQPAMQGTRASEQLGLLLEEVDGFYAGLAVLIDAFRELGVARSTLPSETAELGALYPQSGESTTLTEIYTEMKKLEGHLRWFAEVAGSTPGEARVRALGSSGWELFLDSPLEQAAAFAFAVERCLQIIRHGLVIREKYEELREAEPTDRISDEQIDKDVQATIKHDREELLDDLMERCPEEGARRYEIRIGLSKAIQHLLDKINEGARFEVRVIPPPAGDEAEEVAPGFGTWRNLYSRGQSMAVEQAGRIGLPGYRLNLIEPAAEEVADADGGGGDEGEENAGSEEKPSDGSPPSDNPDAEF